MKSKKSKQSATAAAPDPRFNVAALGLDANSKSAAGTLPSQVDGWDRDAGDDDQSEPESGPTSESQSADEDEDEEEASQSDGESRQSDDDDDDEFDDQDGDDHAYDIDKVHSDAEDDDDDSASPSAPRKKVISETDVEKFKAKRDRTGLVYLSRVPPFMPHEVVRKLLSQYATLGRMYLAPEDPKSSARRKKYKKNGRKMYTEGWVEVLDKREAKAMASNLNNQIVGGKKLSKWHDCIWNIKYLPKFKWHHLTEQISYERRQREQRLRAEIMQAKRENKVYLENVAKSKMITAMKDKNKQKRKRAEAEAESAGGDVVPTGDKSVAAAAAATNAVSDLDGIRRRFKQRKVVHDVEEVEDRDEDLSKVKGVLSKIFG
ncbi:hypothetical protein BCR44DRAFT_42281, partial [Catenaria anguillulae PL171]